MIAPALVFLKALFGGIGWRGWLALTTGGALLTAVVMVRSADRDAGAMRERQRIERANDAADDKADEAEQRYRACMASRKSLAECVPGASR